LANGKKKKGGLGSNQLDWIQDTVSDARTSTRLIEVPLIDLVESQRLKLRDEFPDIEGLAADIERHGQTTPAFVRPLANQRYELISGYRRRAALEYLNRETILARLFPDISDEEAERLAISENFQREELSDLEKARMCLRLKEQGLKVKEISELLGRKGRTVSLYLAVGRAPEKIRDALHQGRLTLYVAYELAQACKPKSAYVCTPKETAPAEKKRARRKFRPVRFTERKKGFDLVVKLRHEEDLEPIIEVLEKTLGRLKAEQKQLEGEDSL
jgi:ParB/RepB/Spo0J family partition protein